MKSAPHVDPEALYRAELEHLFSGIVDPHTHLGRILRHLADAHFGGRDDALKEFAIAVDALGRPASFDPKLDSIVRVEVHKLRRLLREYYEGPGSARPVSVLISPGGYRLAFSIAEPPPQNPAVTSPDEIVSIANSGPDLAEHVPLPLATPPLVQESKAAATRPRMSALLGWAAAGVFVVALALVWFRTGMPDRDSAANAAKPPELTEATLALPNAPPDRIVLPLRLSSGALEPYTDRNGRTWDVDRLFEGGRVARNAVPVIHFTRAPEVYRSRREGDFHYRIPVPPGVYELRLHFAETQYGDTKRGGGESSRMFRISVNGKAVIDPIDVVSDAGGPDTALVRVFAGVRPDRDGRISIRFESLVNEKAFVNGLELFPGLPDRALPRRMAVGTSKVPDPNNEAWEPEDLYSGGRLTERTHPVSGGPAAGLFAAERFGHFRYRLPTIAGHTYTLSLWAAEQFFSVEAQFPLARQRRFDIIADGLTLVREVKLLQEAGGPLKAWNRTFRGLKATPQGYAEIRFRPDSNYALLNALEWIDEGPAPIR